MGSPLGFPWDQFQIPQKRRVFVSYHHALDQWSYNQFAMLFASTYDCIIDRSLDDPINSTNMDYVHRVIREENITGTSCTVVLCGAETWKRKFVDWELHSTVDKSHGLLGILLPSVTYSSGLYSWDRKAIVPPRLHDNVVVGYAHLINWTDQPSELVTAVNYAVSLASSRVSDNSRVQMSANLP
jgi:hypothetical protein